VDLLRESKTRRFYCAYDTPDDYEPLNMATNASREKTILELFADVNPDEELLQVNLNLYQKRW